MSTPRNFRKLLDVDPDARPFNCVGVTAGGERCGQFMFDRGDLSRASSLLTKMESQTLKGSYRYLEELAFLTLCPRWHRNPGYSQVALVTLRWTQKIQQREKEEAEMAMTFAMKQAIARKAVAAEEVKVTIKEERTGKVTCMSLAIHLSQYLTLWSSRSLLPHRSHKVTDCLQM